MKKTGACVDAALKKDGIILYLGKSMYRFEIILIVFLDRKQLFSGSLLKRKKTEIKSPKILPKIKPIEIELKPKIIVETALLEVWVILDMALSLNFFCRTDKFKNDNQSPCSKIKIGTKKMDLLRLNNPSKKQLIIIAKNNNNKL